MKISSLSGILRTLSLWDCWTQREEQVCMQTAGHSLSIPTSVWETWWLVNHVWENSVFISHRSQCCYGPFCSSGEQQIRNVCVCFHKELSGSILVDFLVVREWWGRSPAEQAGQRGQTCSPFRTDVSGMLNHWADKAGALLASAACSHKMSVCTMIAVLAIGAFVLCAKYSSHRREKKCYQCSMDCKNILIRFWALCVLPMHWSAEIFLFSLESLHSRSEEYFYFIPVNQYLVYEAN